MPKILGINVTANSGSTGRLAEYILNMAAKDGWQTYMAYGRNATHSSAELIRIGSKYAPHRNALLARLLDNEGFNAKAQTREFIEKVERIAPDIVHIHNLHGYYINIEILFDYLTRKSIPIVLTMHDCWTFTGHCAYFESADCYKWETHCQKCPQTRAYPASFFRDNSPRNFDRKKRIFNSPERIVYVPVSQWLDRYVGQSYLKDKPHRVIYNGIDLEDFKPTPTQGLREKYDITRPKVVLGVGSIWDKRKGIDDFCRMPKHLPDDVQIVLVGVTEKDRALLPKDVIGISRTENICELAALYSLADVFANPTYEDNMPTVNLEALACGTPLVTYNTGGSPESLQGRTDIGSVVEKGNLGDFTNAVNALLDANLHDLAQKCTQQARTLFSKEVFYQNYKKLFDELLDSAIR